MKKHISYNKFVRNVILLSMFLVACLFFLYGTYIQSSSIEKSIKQDTQTMTTLVFQNLYNIMKNGGNKELIEHAIEDIEKNIPHVNISIIKTYDDNKKQIVIDAINTKTPQIFQHNQHIDFATPIIFKSECLACHTTSSVGDVAAVTLIEHPILDLKISLKEILTMASILFAISIIVFFGMWFHFLKKYFINPINHLITQIDKNRNHQDLHEQIVIESNIKEIKHLEHIFNKKNKELLKSYISLEEASNTDSLTGIYNRKKFEEYALVTLNDSKRYNHDFSLILIDLNKFKPINDTYGHDVGDEVLIFFARSILQNIRETDYLFRVGGDEFVLLLNNTTSQEAQVIVNKIKLYFQGFKFKHNFLEIEISASFGIAQFNQDGDTIDDLLKIADQKMYQNKNQQKR